MFKIMFNLYRVRQTVQILSYILFICLLIYIDPLTERGKTVNFFVRLSPLSAIGAMVAAREIIVSFWPALVLLVSTVIIGRYFCSWVCPFGTTIDITDKLFSRKRNKRKVNQVGNGKPETEKKIGFYDKRRLKYYILAFLLAGAVAGIQMAGWFDPLSLATNTYTILVHPYVVSVIDSFFYVFYDLPFIGKIIKPVHGQVKTVLFANQPPFFKAHFIFLVIFTGIVSVGLVYRRYWCRNICPLGAVLALVSDRAIFKRTVGSGCTSCKRCEKSCSMGAISDNGKGTFAGECTLCFTCQKVCTNNAVQFVKNRTSDQTLQIDLSKRKILTAGIAGVVAAPVLNLKSGKLLDKTNPSIIRPPGASIEEKFIDKCLRCGECMRVCKTNGLHPVIFEDTFFSFWTPTLVPRIGYCDYECTLCGRVCPSGAIKKLGKKEKQSRAIGKAKINHNRCIPWVGFAAISELEKDWKDVNCAVCEEVCPVPVKAIRFDPYTVSGDKEIRRVFVVEDLCIGCGFCEKVCPVSGHAAIRVEGVQPQTVIRGLQEPESVSVKNDVVNLFPERINSWVRESDPLLYKGGNTLFKYINGGADPYLSYSFVQVAVANYAINSPVKSVKIDIWEFGSTGDAYGVFSKDRAGKAIDIGNEGAIYENYLWVWAGKYFILIEPQEGVGDVTSMDVSALGETIVSGMKWRGAKRPAVVDLLPVEGLIAGSVKFFHEKIVIDNVYIFDQFVEDNVFNLSGKTDVVIGEYKNDDNNPPLKLMIVKYSDVFIAEKSQDNLVNLRKQWGEQLVETVPFSTFSDSSGRFYSVCRADNFIVATFFATSLQESTKYVKSVLNIVKID